MTDSAPGLGPLPQAARYVIVGAGVHGLSTAWHLGKALRLQGRREAGDIVVLDKTGVGAGASGIACGVVRNNYFQPAMRRLIAHSVDVWESDPEAFSYHGVGYLQIAPEVMADDVAQIYDQQRDIGYPSTLVTGEAACRAYLSDIFDDWQAPGITVVLHEHRGGYANNLASLRGLAAKVRAEDVPVHDGTQVRGVHVDGGAVTAVETDRGTIACDHLVVAVGPWVRQLWEMLDLPATVRIPAPDGEVHERDMWTYWSLQEGTLAVDPRDCLDNRGQLPPVVHVDSDAPLYDDSDGSLISDRLWGIYYKPDYHFGGVQGGTTPNVVAQPADQVAVDPYGPASPDLVVGDDFARMWTSALAHCQKRYAGQAHRYLREPSGGIGCFTPDSFPVFDTFAQNAYVVADSNHGYKMLGVGALVAEELLGRPQDLLEPFRYARYEQGRLHPTSHSPFPWS